MDDGQLISLPDLSAGRDPLVERLSIDLSHGSRMGMALACRMLLLHGSSSRHGCRALRHVFRELGGGRAWRCVTLAGCSARMGMGSPSRNAVANPQKASLVPPLTGQAGVSFFIWRFFVSAADVSGKN